MKREKKKKGKREKKKDIKDLIRKYMVYIYTSLCVNTQTSVDNLYDSPAVDASVIKKAGLGEEVRDAV